MSGSVTQCEDCHSNNYVTSGKCTVCGGPLIPGLRQVHAYMMETSPEFRAMVEINRAEENKKKGGQENGKSDRE